MKAIIPVAGRGTRLRPLAHTLPKALIPVAGRPMIDWIMDRLIAAGLSEAVFIVGYMGDKIEQYIRKTYPQIISSFVIQEEMLGLGHAVYLGLKEDEKEVFIILGDTLFDADVSAIRNSSSSVLGVKEVADPRRFGVAEINANRITKLVEKPREPKSNLALIGLYNIKEGAVLRAYIEEMMSSGKTSRGEYQITDALQTMIDNGYPFEPCHINGWYDCGKKETLLETNEHYLKENDKRSNPVKIGNSLLIPPVHIGENVYLDASIVGPNVSIDADCKLSKVVISDSLICKKSLIENVVLENSVIGEEAVVQSSIKILNVSDHSELNGI
jgi:glucose-1-phosphate thymidylyltransferase